MEAEQAVLGSMLIDPRCVPDVIEQLRPEDFYIRQNREIYETIYSMFNFSLTIDPVTVLENMRKNGGLRRECLPQLHPPADGHHAHCGQRGGVRGHHQGQDPAAAHRPRRRGT